MGGKAEQPLTGYTILVSIKRLDNPFKMLTFQKTKQVFICFQNSAFFKMAFSLKYFKKIGLVTAIEKKGPTTHSYCSLTDSKFACFLGHGFEDSDSQSWPWHIPMGEQAFGQRAVCLA